MADTPNALASAPDAPPLSEPARVVNTFIEPSSTFRDIKRNRSWWLPFVIFVVLGYIFTVAAVRHVGWDSLVTNVLRSNPKSAERMSNAPPAQQAQTFAITKGIMEGVMAGSPLLVLLGNAVVALLLWAGFSFLLGGSTNFPEMFAVAIFAALPNALNSIVSTVVALVSDPQTYNLNVPSPAALAYFLSSDSPAWLISLGKSIDLFSLWSLALAGLGGAIVSKVKPSRGILMVFGVWLLYVLIKVGIAAATS